MGMAASQARYLELTARKSNVEYEGQQVNQQRTDLSNQSAGLFAQLSSLAVPTAPSSSDYTKVAYTFSDGINTYTLPESGITQLTGDPNYNATVVYSSMQSIYTGVGNSRSNMAVSGAGTPASPYVLGTTTLSNCNASDTNIDAEKTALLQVCKDTYNKTNKTNSQIASDLGFVYGGTDTDNLDAIKTNIAKAYTYTASNNTQYFLSATDLGNLSGKTGTINTYYAANISTNVPSTQKAYLQTSDSDSGRFSNITLADSSSPYSMTCTTTTDSNSYNDALNNYNYQQSLYQQEVTNLNAKTSVIQQEDRSLELRLRQLDTEQQALSTELDSVKKVIDKNIESTFKTFSS